MTAIVLIIILIAILGIYGVLLKFFGLKGFSYKRFFPKTEAFPGETVDFVEVIRNKSILFIPWLRLETKIPDSFDFHTREDVKIRSSSYLKSAFTLMPFSQVTRRHRVRLLKRGHYVLTNASLTYGDLTGMSSNTCDITSPAEVYVFPRLLTEDQLEIPSSRWQGDVNVRRWIQPDPFLVGGIRPYQNGDAERDIHWAATARMGDLQVKVHDYTADPKLMILLNVQKNEAQWADVSEADSDVIEGAITYAASLCNFALSHGIEAGFAANMPVDKGDEWVYVPPTRGTSAADDMMHMFASLSVKKLVSFTTFMDLLPAMSGTDILIVSCYNSPAIENSMEKIRQMGNSVSIYIVEGN